MFLAQRFPPRTILSRVGYERVAVTVFEDLGQLDPVCGRQEQSEDIRAADYGNRLSRRQAQRLVHVMSDLRARSLPVGVPGKDDVAPARKQARQAFERLSAHHHDAAHRQRLEALEVSGKVPGQLAAASDNAVSCASEDKGDERPFHSVHLALSRLAAKRANDPA